MHNVIVSGLNKIGVFFCHIFCVYQKRSKIMIVFFKISFDRKFGVPKEPSMSTNTICFGKEIRKLILIKDLAYNKEYY